MKLLKELITIKEETAVEPPVNPTRTMRQRVYHADYVKTKKKPYRKYDTEEDKK